MLLHDVGFDGCQVAGVDRFRLNDCAQGSSQRHAGMGLRPPKDERRGKINPRPNRLRDSAVGPRACQKYAPSLPGRPDEVKVNGRFSALGVDCTIPAAGKRNGVHWQLAAGSEWPREAREILEPGDRRAAPATSTPPADEPRASPTKAYRQLQMQKLAATSRASSLVRREQA